MIQTQHDELTEIHAWHNEAMAEVQTIRQVLTVRDPIAQRQAAQARGIKRARLLIKAGKFADASRVLESL